jgi:hypothetical protein
MIKNIGFCKMENNKEIVISSNIKLGEQSYDRSNNGNWRAGFNSLCYFFRDIFAVLN